MTEAKVVYALTLVEDGGGSYRVQVGRRGTPAEVAAELRMAADALEGHFADRAQGNGAQP